MFINSKKEFEKALELMWISKDLLEKQSLTEDERSAVIGHLKRAENLLWEIQDKLCEIDED